MEYRRLKLPGRTYFFVLATNDRTPIFTNEEAVTHLRNACRYVKDRMRFKLDAIVILHDHIHLLMTLPEGDSDYMNRIRLIKKDFKQKYIKKFQKPKKLEIWQDRYWEHCIRDDEDYEKHFDYIHYNPIKHGYVSQVNKWPWSSFHHYVENGIYPGDWGADVSDEIKSMDFE